jgi:hypothetical protein
MAITAMHGPPMRPGDVTMIYVPVLTSSRHCAVVDPQRRRARTRCAQDAVHTDDEPGDAENGAGTPETVLGLVGQLATASEQATLVHVALRSGLLMRCAEPMAVHELAEAIGTDSGLTT